MEVKVIVEKSPDGSYSAYMDEDLPQFGLAGYGDSAKEAIEDFFCSLEDTKQILKDKGQDVPELTFVFTYDQ